ncbi:hypothetical protein TNCV_1724311 [Trichonephila clavipes]|nr:hypothetical protein TNCV_1724311 [Trichonephila clavipes]
MFICYKQSLDNARSIALYQRTGSTHLIEDETFNDIDIISNFIDYKERQKEPDSMRFDKIYEGIQLSCKSQDSSSKPETDESHLVRDHHCYIGATNQELQYAAVTECGLALTFNNRKPDVRRPGCFLRITPFNLDRVTR